MASMELLSQSHNRAPGSRALLVLVATAILGVAQLVGVAAAPTATAQPSFFQDDFESGASSWTADGGSWEVHDDPEGGMSYRQTAQTGGASSISGDGSWTDYNLAVEIDSAQLDDGAVGLLARWADADNYYAARVTADQVELSRTVAGRSTVLATAPYDGGSDGVLLEMELRTDFIKVYVDHHLIVSTADSTLTAGKVGLATWETTAAFDDVRVTEVVELGVMRANMNWYQRFFVDTFQNNLDRWNPTFGDWERIPAEVGNGQDGENSVVEARAGADGVDPFASSTYQSSVQADSTTRVTIVPTDQLDGAGYASVMFRVVDRWNYYAVQVNATTVTLVRRVGNVVEVINRQPTKAEPEPGQPLYLEIDAYGSEIDVYLQHDLAVSATDSTFTEGRIALGAHDAVVRFDDVETNSKFDQFALLDEIKNSGINRVRLTYTRDKYLRAVSDWIKHANEIDLDVLMSLTLTGDPRHYPAGTEKVYGERSWGAYRLSDLDPRLFGKVYRSFLQHLRDERAELTAVGLGNEVNWWGYNGDLRALPDPHVFDLDTDLDDPDFVKVRAGIERYGQLLAQARKITDTVYAPGQVEVISSGLNHPPAAGLMENGRSTVRPALFLTLLAGEHLDQPAGARDYLSMVDQIGVHLYPSGPAYDVNPETGYQSTLEFVTTIMDPIVEAVGTDQPFMIAEAGSYRRDATTKQGELITEQQRLDLYRLFLRTLQDPALDGVDFSTIQMYSFDAAVWAAYEDGELLPVGRVFAEYPY